MNDIKHPDLLAEILAFCEAKAISKADFGRLHMADTSFVYDLEKGRECRQATLKRARGVMTPQASQ